MTESRHAWFKHHLLFADDSHQSDVSEAWFFCSENNMHRINSDFRDVSVVFFILLVAVYRLLPPSRHLAGAVLGAFWKTISIPYFRLRTQYNAFPEFHSYNYPPVSSNAWFLRRPVGCHQHVNGVNAFRL